MGNRIIWAPEAEKDFILILDYLDKNWGFWVATTFINKVDSHIGLIAKDPQLFPVINLDLQIRKCVITKQNTLFYRVKNNDVEIVRLFDTRQNPDKLNF